MQDKKQDFAIIGCDSLDCLRSEEGSIFVACGCVLDSTLKSALFRTRRAEGVRAGQIPNQYDDLSGRYRRSRKQ